MASHTISGALWGNGTTVGVYPAVAVPAGSDVPSGQALTTAVVSGGSVTFSGLSEKIRYYAYGGGKGVGFLIPATSTEGDRARIEDLESRMDLVGTGGGGGAPSGPAGGVLGGTYPNPGFAVDMATQAELDAVAFAAAGGVLSGTYPNPGFAVDMATQAELNAVASASAGGVLGGTYPNPSFAVDMATQAELDAVSTAVAAYARAGGNLIVAATGATTKMKQIADAVCDGVADQVEINAAIATAAAAGDTGRVLLVGPLFTISGPILGKTYTALESPHWRATHIQAASTWTGGTGPTDRPAMIQNFDASTKFWRTRNIALLGNKSGGATVRGIALLNTGGTITWSDPTVTFENTYIEACSGVGFHHGDAARDTSVDRIRIIDCDGNGLLIDGQDSEFARVQVGSCGGDGAADLTSAGAGIRFSANSSNNRMTSFKSWFSNGDGIWLGGVRNQLAAGEMQDNNGNGINFTFDHNTAVGIHADSNNRAFSGTTGDAGIRIGASYITCIGNSYEKLETGRSGSRQQYGVRITSGCTDSVVQVTCFQNTIDNFAGTQTGARNKIFVVGSGATTVDRPLTDANQLTTTSRLGGMQPTGTVATTIVDRTDVAGTFTPTSGTLRLAAGSDIGTYIPAGTVITNLNVLVNSTSGGVTLTNSWLCIVRVSTLAAQATTVNRGTTALLTTGAATVYPIATTLGGGTSGTWTCPVSDVYYIGFCVTGTTMPVLQGNTMGTSAAIAPALTGNSSTALTTPATLPGTVGALSGGGPAFWAWAT